MQKVADQCFSFINVFLSLSLHLFLKINESIFMKKKRGTHMRQPIMLIAYTSHSWPCSCGPSVLPRNPTASPLVLVPCHFPRGITPSLATPKAYVSFFILFDNLFLFVDKIEASRRKLLWIPYHMCTISNPMLTFPFRFYQ